MMRTGKRRGRLLARALGGLMVSTGAVLGCAPDIPIALIAPEEAVTVADIAVRDDLIRRQEMLLNSYRCRFSTDVEAVPGGCVDGVPALELPVPPEFEGVPTQLDVMSREEHIRAQEVLLNSYRCRFGVDTDAVVGGCPESTGETGRSGNGRAS